jgi:AMP-activated protein kinase-like protein
MSMIKTPKKSKNGGMQAANITAKPEPAPVAAPKPVQTAAAKPEPVGAPSQRSAYGAAPAQVAAAKPEPIKTAGPRPGHISLELVRPGAKQVYVAGSFNEWKPDKTPLAPSGNGRWVGDLTVRPGRYEYLFVVDGQWIPDPNAKESVANPFGGKNSVLIASQ